MIDLKLLMNTSNIARSLAAIGMSALLSVSMLAGCQSEPAEQPPAPAVEVTAVTVEARDTAVVFEFVGKTASSRRVEVRSRVEGFLEERLYEEGTVVTEGDILFQMDRKPFEASLQAAEAELAQQVAQRETADANLKRVRPLVEKNAVAQKELDDALGMYRTAAAAVEAAKAKVVQAELDLGYTEIRTPVTGLSSFAVQEEGAYIGMGTGSLLTYVAQLEPMRVEFSISENELLRSRDQANRGRLKAIDENLVVEVVLADGTVYPHVGQITFADASLSEETGTFLLRAEVPNPDRHLRPGQFVRVRLKGAIRPNAVIVSQRAVQQGAKGSFVWLIEDGKAVFRPIEVGSFSEDQWVVSEGLEGGETVVIDGAMKLQAGLPVKVVDGSATGKRDEPE